MAASTSMAIRAMAGAALILTACGEEPRAEQVAGPEPVNPLYPEARYGEPVPPGGRKPEKKRVLVPRPDPNAFAEAAGIRSELAFAVLPGRGAAWLERDEKRRWRLSWRGVGPTREWQKAPVLDVGAAWQLLRSDEVAAEAGGASEEKLRVEAEPGDGVLAGPWQLPKGRRWITATRDGRVIVPGPAGTYEVPLLGEPRVLFAERYGPVVVGPHGHVALVDSGAVYLADPDGTVRAQPVFPRPTHPISAVEVVATPLGLVRLTREAVAESQVPFTRPAFPKGRLELWRWGTETTPELLSDDFRGMSLKAGGNFLFFQTVTERAAEPRRYDDDSGAALGFPGLMAAGGGEASNAEPGQGKPDPNKPLPPVFALWQLDLAAPDAPAQLLVPQFAGSFGASEARVLWVKTHDTGWSLVETRVRQGPAGSTGDRTLVSQGGPVPRELVVTDFAAYWATGSTVFRLPNSAQPSSSDPSSDANPSVRRALSSSAPTARPAQ